jgi:epsilon-lactone hydrolase
MISPQAKIVRQLLKATSNKKGYDSSKIEDHRKAFERNMSLFFPSSSKQEERSSIAGISVVIIRPPVITKRIIIYLHGGGFVFGSPKSHRQHLIRLARMCSSQVIAIDYGLSPKYPYPHALEEIQEVWEELVSKKQLDPKHIVLMGDSAGGGLALASTMRFRDAHLPQPACVVLLSPALDATFSGESYAQNVTKDSILNMRKLEFFARSYAQHHSRKIPFISPVYADLKDLPPLLIHAGSDDLLLSDSQTVAKNAARDGVDVSLFISEGMWHGWHFFASYIPEAKAAMRSVAEYVKSYTRA